jgi:tetratricopeptide (TPR) repeat protein
MERQEKPTAAYYLRRGKRELSTHRPEKAISSLRQAVDAIPPSCSDELSQALYWLSLALLRLDERPLAIKSLASAQKLRRRGYARRLYLRSVNEYGMPRQASPDLDDFYAFTNLQIAYYLVKKSTSRRFDSFQEKDTVLRLILDAWKQLSASGQLSGIDACEKLDIFRNIKIHYPSFGLSGFHRVIVKASFGASRTTGLMAGSIARSMTKSSTDRCPCGSGLPYGQCCGRVKHLKEL